MYRIGYICHLFLFLLIIYVLLSCSRLSAPDAPRRLRCEYQVNPLGIDVLKPRFSWDVNDPRPAARQTAYQILVASRKSLLYRNKADLWNSGKITSSQSHLIPYDGQELYSRAIYYWKVRTWDGRNVASRYSDIAHWEMGLLEAADWHAQWIGKEEPVPANTAASGSASYQPPRSIQVRKEFTPKKHIRGARLYATGLGSYVMYLNGVRVGQDILTPGWTDYKTRLQYQVYDVTRLLQRGSNALAAILGNAWYSSGLGWRGAAVYGRGPMQLFAQLVIDYRDGSSQLIATDQSWKMRESPILENTLYHGETYDARLEIPGWNKAGLNDNDWRPVSVFNTNPVKLVAQQGPSIQVTRELKPVAITEPQPGVYIFDLGQNMVGRARLNVTGPAGTRVQLRFGELLNPDGTLYTENLRTARVTDTYFCKGLGGEVWEPLFTYHGFRYVEVSGYPGKPSRDAITGVVFHSATPVSGHFACSNPLLNQIMRNIVWGQRGNLHSVPTDCPQRDERLGWMGDAQIFAPTACYNMNMAGFFTKWMRDITDCQDADGAVHDVSPTIVVGGPAAPGWGDAVVVIPWVVYQYYGDKRIIEENYDHMAAWLEYVNKNSKNYLYEREGYGDWIAVVKSPSHTIGAAYFYYDAVLLAQMAEIIDRVDDAAKYRELAGKIAEAFNKKYLDRATLMYPGATQTANLLPLAFGITPDSLKSGVMENIVQDVTGRDFHLSTGFLGTAFLLPMLSDYGYHSIAYKVATQKSYPSWGYMVEKGATTIWELWNSDTEGPSMNSRNHFALGCIGTWYYGYLAGIRPDPEQPGFQHVLISPKPVGDLTWVEAGLLTEYGSLEIRWESEWRSFNLNLSLAPNTSATLCLPVTGFKLPIVTENGRFIYKKGQTRNDLANIKFVRQDRSGIVFELGAGKYQFKVTEGK